MTQKLIDRDIDQSIEIDDSEIGRTYLFWCKNFPDDATFGFSSTLENIGIVEKHDCMLKNKTEVLVLSEPIEANHPQMGTILVSRIIAHTAMWVGSNALVPVDINKPK